MDFILEVNKALQGYPVKRRRGEIMAVDGSLKFDSKVDTSGFKKGTKEINQSSNSMMSSVKKLGVAIGIAFGVTSIIGFAKASVKASTELENAMIGLQSIMEGHATCLCYRRSGRHEPR